MSEDLFPRNLRKNHFPPPDPEWPIIVIRIKAWPGLTPVIRRLQHACKLLHEQCLLQVLSVQTETGQPILLKPTHGTRLIP
jgi:hypothetical protein